MPRALSPTSIIMITEDQLEQLAIQWFQDTGKLASRNPSSQPSPTGRRRKTAEREALRTLTPALCLRPSPLRSGSQGEKEKDGRLAEAVRIPGSRQISRQSVARGVVEVHDMNRDMVSRFGGESGGKLGIATKIATGRFQRRSFPEEARATIRRNRRVQIERKRDP